MSEAEPQKMRVAIVGAGAIGGWIAAKLASGGHQVAAFNSSGPVDRLVIEEKGETAAVKCAAFSGAADMLIVAVKATALKAAAEKAPVWIDANTTIVPMLNGVPWWFVEGQPLAAIDPDGSVAEALPYEQIVGCVVHASCFRSEQGHIVVKHADKLILGDPRGGSGELVEQLCASFELAGVSCEASADIRRAIWYKLWGNATINPLSALTRATADRILADAECRAWMLAGMAELATIGAAIGCPITESGEDRMAVTARLGAFKTSMHQDVEAGRRIELDALLGAPREIARAAGIETPALDRLYGLTALMAENLGLL